MEESRCEQSERSETEDAGRLGNPRPTVPVEANGDEEDGGASCVVIRDLDYYISIWAVEGHRGPPTGRRAMDDEGISES